MGFDGSLLYPNAENQPALKAIGRIALL